MCIRDRHKPQQKERPVAVVADKPAVADTDQAGM